MEAETVLNLEPPVTQLPIRSFDRLLHIKIQPYGLCAVHGPNYPWRCMG